MNAVVFFFVLGGSSFASIQVDTRVSLTFFNSKGFLFAFSQDYGYLPPPTGGCSRITSVHILPQQYRTVSEPVL